MLSALTSFDFAVLDWIRQNLSTPLLDDLMVAVTRLGDAGMIWIVLALFLCFFRKTRGCGILMLLGLILSVLIGNGLLKNLIQRDRPCWIRDMTDLLVAVPTDFSFPSGHTMSSFVSATVLLRCDKRIGIPALVLAFLVAFSRLYLFVHFPSDILGGMLLGVMIGSAVWLLAPWLNKKLGIAAEE